MGPKRWAILSSLCLLMLGLGVYAFVAPSEPAVVLLPPSFDHWFGTDLAGRDVLAQTFQATWVTLLTIVSVGVAVHVLGLILGAILAQARSHLLRELLTSLVNYWLTVPVLLIAIFVMILLGAGQAKLIIVLIAALTPTQALYVYVRVAESQKQSFVMAKRAYGFSRLNIFMSDLLPFVHPSVRSYTLSRLPEILVMDLAFNYLGLGVQPPHTSLGRMMFAGLPFMFAGWWIWLCPLFAITIIAVVIITSQDTEKLV